MDKILLHCDMNNYFASVESIFNEELKAVPMVVCGDPATRHGIVLAKNNLAKESGIMTGESVFSAMQKVPSLKVVNADYSRYVRYAKLARQLYGEYSGEVIPYGLDEAWIDLTGKVDSIEFARVIADEIRERIKSELQLTASVGVSFNYIFSKLASDMKKPDATTVLLPSDLKTIIWNRPAFDMLFVGPATRKKLKLLNILTIGDIANTDVKLMQRYFGKNGLALWMFANGNDSSFNPRVSEDEPFKSMGNTITLPKDLVDEADILSLLFVLTKTVSARLKKHGLKARCVSIQIKYSDFRLINRQLTLREAADSGSALFYNAKKLFAENHEKNGFIRSLGVHVTRLEDSGAEQMSLFGDEEDTDSKAIADRLKSRLGEFAIEKSAMSEDGLFDNNNFWD